MSGRDTPESLNEARQRFSQFLRSNGYPEEVLWVESTDVVWDRRQVWVRARPTNMDRACRRYQEGIRNGHGVSLHAFSELEQTTVATIVLPKDEDEAARALIPHGGLKLSADAKKLTSRRVTNRLTWLILSALHRADSRSFWDGYLGLS